MNTFDLMVKLTALEEAINQLKLQIIKYDLAHPLAIEALRAAMNNLRGVLNG